MGGMSKKEAKYQCLKLLFDQKLRVVHLDPGVWIGFQEVDKALDEFRRVFVYYHDNITRDYHKLAGMSIAFMDNYIDDLGVNLVHGVTPAAPTANIVPDSPTSSSSCSYY